MLGGKPTCPSCGNALREPIACTACGRMTKRPGRSPDHDGLVCEPCRLAATHATCSRCRRHRAVARRDDGGRPMSKPCGSDAPASHPRPDCGAGQPGAGSARCAAYSLRRRIARAAEAEAEAPRLRQEWAKDLFTALCGSIDAGRAPGDTARRTPGHAAFFAVLDAACAGAAHVMQSRLLDLFGAEGLRRAESPARFLIDRLALSWEAQAGHLDSDRRRIAGTRAAARDQPWSGDLDAYREHLATERKIAAGTARMYMAAARLLVAIGGDRAGRRPHPGARAPIPASVSGAPDEVMRFLSWIPARTGACFDAGSGHRTPPRKPERATLRVAATLLARLAATLDERGGRAVLAAAIIVIHGMPLVRVLSLRHGQLVIMETRTVLWPDAEAIELATALSSALARFSAVGGTLVFPGRNAAQPMTASAVRHHVGAMSRDPASKGRGKSGTIRPRDRRRCARAIPRRGTCALRTAEGV